MKSLLVVLFVIMGSLSFGQVVTENKIWSNVMMEQKIVEFIQGDDTTYTFYYRNQKYKQLVSYEHISFDSKSEIIDFAETCLEVFDLDKNQSLQFPKYYISKFMGQCGIFVENKGYTYISKKKLNKLIETMKQ